ncbi:MAG: DUF4249 domain-containing protein [Ferruginibacter sp.]
MNKIPFIIVFCLIIFSGCEKNIDFDLKNAEDVLVVDANIENGRPPVVILTHSLNFFSTIDPALLLNSFVRNAEVTVSNGVLTHRLKEYATQVGGGITVYSYSIDSANLATAFAGAFNTHYTLDIKSGGKEYTAETTIPLLAKKADSLWWKPAPFSDDTNNVVVMVKATDPPGLGNYVRYFTRKNSGPFLPGDNSVFDDQIINNTTYELQVDPGVDRNRPIDFDSNYFKRGDTVTLKLCNIDKTTYAFWSTWEFAFQSVGNPFAQPNKVIGNISNGALGAFYGYAAFYKTLVVDK